jgi:hypothetical protein
MTTRFNNRIARLERLAPPPPSPEEEYAELLRWVSDQELDRLIELTHTHEPRPGWEEGLSQEEVKRIKDQAGRLARATADPPKYPLGWDSIEPLYPIPRDQLGEEALAEIEAIEARALDRQARRELPPPPPPPSPEEVKAEIQWMYERSKERSGEKPS